METPTVISACSLCNWVDCGFVSAGGWASTHRLPQYCGRPASYIATSTAAARNDMVFLVCVEHAPEVRLMDWLGSLKTYQP